MVSTDVGGNGEIIRDGIEGILIPAADSEKLKEAILEMSNNSGLRDACKKKIEKNDYLQFSNEYVDKQLDMVYQQMLSRK